MIISTDSRLNALGASISGLLFLFINSHQRLLIAPPVASQMKSPKNLHNIVKVAFHGVSLIITY
jgi:hypothetical protein